MTVGFRSDAETINGTAGTSVVVSRPSGTAAGDVLVAFISGTGTPTISTPSGWTLLGTVTAGSAVRAAAFYLVADGTEPASWTWTLGSSVRNGGTVGAYTGVDITDPILDFASTADTTAGTSWVGPGAIVDPFSGVVGFAALSRTATGTGTTHTTTGTKRADQTTNGGSGVDLSYAVGAGAVSGSGTSAIVVTSSQPCANGALWTVILRPAFFGYDGGLIEPIVEAAFGADPDDPDPETNWVWTDISAQVLEDSGVRGSKGRQNEQAQMAPTDISFTVLNPNGDWTPDNPTGGNYPNIRRRLPVRVSVPFGYESVNPRTEIATAFVESFTPGWDTSLKHATVDIQAYGRLAQVRQGDALRSPMFRSVTNTGFGDTPAPTAYWPMEDGSGATRLAAERGGRPISVDNLTRPASDSDMLGSAPLPTLDPGGRIIAVLDANPATGRFGLVVAIRMDTPPGNNVALIDVYTNGSVAQWRVFVAPGSPDTINFQLWDGNNNVISTTTQNLVEAEFYGGWRLHSVTCIQNGADIDWEQGYYRIGAGTSQSGTATNRTLRSVTRVVIGGNNVFTGGVGHLAVFTDPAWTEIFASFISASGLGGNNNDEAWIRFLRLLTEEGVPFETVNGDFDLQLLMGPQPIASLGDLLREVEDADQGVVHDGGESGALVFVARNVRYNRPVDLALDMESGHIASGWRPTYDTQTLRTESTVSRAGGSSATYRGSTAEGRNKDTLTVNHPTDERLLDVASWRTAIGSTPGMRYPKVEVDLRRNPALTQNVLRTRVGESRLTGTGLPSELGPTDLDGFVEGYAFELSTTRWRWTANLSPAAPYDVGIWEDDVLGRADTAGSELGSGINTTATALSVATTSGPIWITTATKPAQFPFAIKVGGEVMTVTAITGASSPQTFTVTRSVNGVVKSHSSGAAVTLANPMIAAL